MILELNTETKKVIEKPQPSDKNISKDELESDISSLLATALAGVATKSFTTYNVREAYIRAVAKAAINLLTMKKEEKGT